MSGNNLNFWDFLPMNSAKNQENILSTEIYHSEKVFNVTYI